LERLRRSSSELLRLRNEVVQLRRERQEEKPLANAARPQPAKVHLQARNSDARYFPREELSHAGYATPLTAIRTITYAIAKGSYEEVLEAMGPEMRAIELREPN